MLGILKGFFSDQVVESKCSGVLTPVVLSSHDSAADRRMTLWSLWPLQRQREMYRCLAVTVRSGHSAKNCQILTRLTLKIGILIKNRGVAHVAVLYLEDTECG